MGVTCDVGKAFVLVNLGVYSIDKQSEAIRDIPHKWFQSYPQVREKSYQLGTYPLWECSFWVSVGHGWYPSGIDFRAFQIKSKYLYSFKLQYT